MRFAYKSKCHPLTPCRAFFLPSQSLPTFGPDDRVLYGNAWRRMTLCNPMEMMDVGAGIVPWKFPSVYSLKKPIAALSSWSHFEHCRT